MDDPTRNSAKAVNRPSTYSVYINKQFDFLKDIEDDVGLGDTKGVEPSDGGPPQQLLVHITDSTLDGRTAKRKPKVQESQLFEGLKDSDQSCVSGTVCNGVAESPKSTMDKVEKIQSGDELNNNVRNDIEVPGVTKDSCKDTSNQPRLCSTSASMTQTNSSQTASQKPRKESIESQIISSSFSFLPQYETSVDKTAAENGDDDVIVPMGTLQDGGIHRQNPNKPMSRVSQFITDQFDFLPAYDDGGDIHGGRAAPNSQAGAEGAASAADGDTDSVLTGSQSLSTSSDCSEDNGKPWVYAESFRYSNYVLDDSKAIATGSHSSSMDGDPIMTSVTPEHESIDLDTDNPCSPWFDGDALVNNSASHVRSESTSTTASERDFRDRYLADGLSEGERSPHIGSPCPERNGGRGRRIIRRSSSTSTYKRLSEKFTEAERRIEVVRQPEDGDHYGFHLLGPSPVLVSTVEADSAAFRAGILCGDIIFSVNDENVLENTLEEVIEAINKTGTGNLVLGVCANPDKFLSERPLCSGYLEKQADTNIFKGRWKRRWFELKPDNCLYYYKNEKDDTPMGALPLANYTVIKATDVKRDNVFKLVKYGNKTHYLQAESADDMDRWASVISSQAPASRNEAWLEVSTNNVGLPALSIKKPDCHGYLYKLGQKKSWRKRYCVLKDACLYYYGDVTSSTAKGVAHLHGYTLKEGSNYNKKFTFTLTPPETTMRTFCFCSENETDMKRWCSAMESSIGKWVKVPN